MSAMCRKRTYVPCELSLVVADTANLISNLRVQGSFLQRLVCARARPPVGGLFYRSLGGILHNRFTERSAALALNVFQLFAPIPIRCGRYDAVRGVGAPLLKVWILEAVLALVEHFQRLRPVLFHCGHCSLKHGLGFLCGTELSRPECGGSKKHRDQREADGESGIA